MTNLAYESRPYRPCVGIMLVNKQGLIFAGQRIDNKAEAWQMPQGGIDPGEDAEQACFREMEEEIGTAKADIGDIYPEWLYYDIPLPLADKLWEGQFKGQKQRWIGLRFTGTDADINIATAEPEFKEWAWLKPDELITRAVVFKRPVYQTVITHFSDLLKV